MSIEIEIIDGEQRFADLRSEWNSLLSASPADCMFLTWEWLSVWWNHFRAGGRLSIVVIRNDGAAIAIAPLAIRRRAGVATLEFLGVGPVGSDYLDFIVHPEFEGSAVGALIRFIEEMRLPLRLPSVRADSVVARLISPLLEDLGWRSRTVPMQPCPFIDLRARSFDEYLDSIGAAHRYNFRRRLRNLNKKYDCEFAAPDSDDARAGALQQLVDLHLVRWSKRGGSDAFHQQRLIAFHRDFIALAHERDWLRLRTLRLDGRTAAAVYGFHYDSRYLFYQSGFDEAFARDSVGLVAIGLTIKEAIAEGAVHYDFLHGDEPYKFLWASETTPLLRCELYAPGISGRLHRDGAIAVAAMKKTIKRALKIEASA